MERQEKEFTELQLKGTVKKKDASLVCHNRKSFCENRTEFDILCQFIYYYAKTFILKLHISLQLALTKFIF